MATFIEDARVALRSFARRPAFVLVAAATLAAGVGAMTMIFSVVNAVLLAPLPYPEPDRLVRVGQVSRDPDRIYAMSYLDFHDLQERNRSFEGLAASQSTGVTLVGDGDPELYGGALVSPEFFATVGVEAVRG